MPDASPASTSAAAPKRREAAIVIGSMRITGWRAQAIQAVIFGALGALVAFRVAQRVQQQRWSQMIGHAWPLYASISLWIVFTIYWGVAARSESAVRSAESKGSRAFHLLLINGSMLLIYISLPGLGGRFIPDTPIVHVVGIALQATFFLFAVWARRTLGRNWSGDVTVKVDHELIRTGPYRRIRHPIYTAMFGMYAGAAIAVGEVHSLVALGVLMLAYARKIGLEETTLSTEFGSTYADYRRRSWAVIPPVW